MDIYDVIIIGAGPAGLSAGLYCARYGLNTLILEKGLVGGQIALSMEIENYPGYLEKSTSLLIENMHKQIGELGIKIETAQAIKIDCVKEIKNVFSENNCYAAKSLIIASGAFSKKLDVVGEDKFIGRGVSYCATCDGPLFKNKEVSVIGGGDRALEEALFLTTYALKVNLIHRRSDFRGSAILKEKVKQNKKIKIILESVVEEIMGETKVSGLKLRNIKNNTTQILASEGIFIFVGIVPNTGFVKTVLQLDADGFIITDMQMRTSQSGVFAAGDCRAKDLRQVVTAVADGALAAYSAKQFVKPY